MKQNPTPEETRDYILGAAASAEEHHRKTVATFNDRIETRGYREALRWGTYDLAFTETKSETLRDLADYFDRHDDAIEVIVGYLKDAADRLTQAAMRETFRGRDGRSSSQTSNLIDEAVNSARVEVADEVYRGLGVPYPYA